MKNYFTLLGIVPSFDLNEAELQKRYVALQREHHPDRLVGKPEAERATAILLSMDINEAYEALKSPLERANHLLELQDIHVNGEQDTVKPSEALLMEVMELREELSEAEDKTEIVELIQDARRNAQICTESLRAAFNNKDFDKAAQEAIRLRYLGKLLEEALGRQYQMMAAS